MKSIFIGKVIIFLIVLLTPIYWVSRFDNNIINPINTNFARIFNSYNYDSLDFLVIGNSHAFSAIYPEYFDSLGFEIYNYALSGAGLLYYDLILDDYLKNSTKEPESILIGISPYLFSSQCDRWNDVGYHRNFNPPISSERIMLKYDFDLERYLKITQNSFVKGFHYMRVREQTNPLCLIDQSDDYRGFYFRYDTFSMSLYKQNYPLYKMMLEDEFPDKRCEKLNQFIRKIEMAGSNPIVIEPPRNRLDDFFSKAYLEQYDLCLKELENNGIEIIRNSLLLDSVHYRDIDHLNVFGAKIYTKSLIDQLNL